MAKQQMVYIVDDDGGARSSVEALVREMGVSSQSFASAEAFLGVYDGKRRGCLVADVRLGGMSGLDLQDELATRGWWLPTVIITAYAETPLTVRAMRNCALTVLEKPCRQHELWDAIREALKLDGEYHRMQSRTRKTQDCLEQLLPAEREVLDLLVNGVRHKIIASQLGISTRTVEARRHNILRKMEVESVAKLVQLVVEARVLRQAQFPPCPKKTPALTS